MQVAVNGVSSNGFWQVAVDRVNSSVLSVYCILEKNSEKRLTGQGKICIMEKQSAPVQVQDSK